MQIIVNQLLTSYTIFGKGKTILLLHGWGDNSVSFNELAAELSRDYEVIAVDLPGFGGSQAPFEPWDLTRYSSFIAAFLKKIERSPWVVIGHSNGGAVALYGIAHGAFSPKRLILLGSAGIRNPQNARLKLLRMATKIGKAASYPLPSDMKKRLRQKLYSSVGSDMLVAEHMEETFKRVVSQDVLDEASKINIPTLLIYGQNDTATPVTYGEKFHQAIKNSELVVVPDAGHFVHHDEPAYVEKAIRTFLQ